MLFHISYSLRPEHRDAAQARFQETGAQPPDGVLMHGRWHAVSGRRGFLLAEASDPVAVTEWMQEWTDLVTFEVEPVIDDEQFSGVIG